jgi:CheY-like chemotaxis protein
MIKKEDFIMKLSILMVDDNETIRRIQAAIVEKGGHHVRTASGGREALQLIKQQLFDVIMMDMQMPDMDGITTAREIRAQGVNTPIIAVTGNNELTDQQACQAAGMNRFLTKPITLNSVQAVFHSINHSKNGWQ